MIATTAISQAKKTQTTKATTTTKTTATAYTFKNLKDSTSYALGVNIARNLKAQNLDKIDAMLLYKGLSDVLLGKKVALNDEVSTMCVNSFYQKMNPDKGKGAATGGDKKQMEEIAKNKAAGQKFLAENAKKAGVITMPEGWQYEVLKTSESKEHPTATSTVKCHYHGTLTDGTVFDSSVERGEPISFPLNGVIKGWTLSVPMMTVGSKWKVFLPSDLAYGDNAAGPKIPGGSTLIFEIELIGIDKM
jgi:FKBP-type peptidyl-prolyl cis-trans isomerase FklB